MLWAIASWCGSGANSRLARVLLVRLLQRAGYGHLSYASLEHQIEQMRHEYYEAYDRAQVRFWSGEATLEPWIEFIVEALSRQRERVAAKLDTLPAKPEARVAATTPARKVRRRRIRRGRMGLLGGQVAFGRSEGCLEARLARSSASRMAFVSCPSRSAITCQP